LVVVPVLVAERGLGALVLGDLVLRWREALLELLVAGLAEHLPRLLSGRGRGGARGSAGCGPCSVTPGGRAGVAARHRRPQGCQGKGAERLRCDRVHAGLPVSLVARGTVRPRT